MRHIQPMYLKFCYCVLYTSIYRLTERKKRFHVQNCPCGTVSVKIDCCRCITRRMYWNDIKYDL